MRKLSFIAACIIMAACSKENANPADNGNYNNNNSSQSSSINTHHADTSSITVFVNDTPMTVTTIDYSRSGSTFNFLARNSFQKLEVNCFYFYQHSGFNYMYSDSITYSTRSDSLAEWNTITAKPAADTVEFNCCIAPLTDKIVKGNYGAGFSSGKDELNVRGSFNLKF